jgi:hypothetical protein
VLPDHSCNILYSQDPSQQQRTMSNGHQTSTSLLVSQGGSPFFFSFLLDHNTHCGSIRRKSPFHARQGIHLRFEKDGHRNAGGYRPGMRSGTALTTCHTKKKHQQKQRLCPSTSRTAFRYAASSIRSQCFGNSSNPISLEALLAIWTFGCEGTAKPRNRTIFSPLLLPFIKGKCMPPGESQLAYIWPFDEDWEKPRRSPSPHLF